MPEGDAEMTSDDKSTLPEGHPLADIEPAIETTAPPDPPPPASDTDLAKELEKWKALAQKHEARSKLNATAATELEKLRKAAMSDQEKAVAAAREAGFNEAKSLLGGQMVAAQFRAAAAGRLDAKVLDAMLARLDTAAFLGDDNEVDEEAIAAFVESIAPPPAQQEESTDPRWPDLGQGQQGATPIGSSDLERVLRTVVSR